jgi:biotin operon repressor
MKWTNEKIELLKNRYPNEDNGALARELGCSRKALAFRASSLGVKKTEAANEERYARMGYRIPQNLQQGEKRKIATGTVIIKGHILTHISNASLHGA